jgi:hypothetical protein
MTIAFIAVDTILFISELFTRGKVQVWSHQHLSIFEHYWVHGACTYPLGLMSLTYNQIAFILLIKVIATSTVKS